MGLVDGKTMQVDEETTAESTGFPADILNDFMAGDEIFLGFSGGTIGVVVGLIVISVLGGIISRRFLFPRIMDLISKSERIDGKTLLAPKSLGWMMGFLILSLIHI